MERIRRSLIPGIVIAAALILILAQALPGPSAGAQAPGNTGPQYMSGGQPIVLMAAEGEPPLRVPPREPASGIHVQSATITINYLANGTTNALGDPCVSWPAGAVTAFNYAKTIWAEALNSTVPIVINACWATGLPSGVLGHSASTGSYRDFSGAPQTGTWYSVALANALAHTDLNGSTAEMEIAYSSTFSWYYGTDGVVPGNQYDLVSVVLHEIAHGLGFAGSMRVAGGLGSWGGGTGFPIAYDRFTENGSGQKLITAFPNNSVALATQLTSDNIYFNGTKANAANGGSRPKLYAPNPWKSGSSYAHLDEIFNTSNGGRDSLMTWSISYGQSIHDPGPVSMGIFQDVGWTVPAGPPTPTRTNTPTSVPTTPIATPVSRVYVPLVVRSTAAPSLTVTPVPGLGIHGRVTSGGSAASGVSLLLRYYNGAAWSTRGTATTDVSGNYDFFGAPALGPSQAYYVRYDNNLSSNTRLSLWQAPLLNSYAAGATADGGSFDVANIALSSPPGDSILPLPVTFRWVVRPATTSDSYEFNIFEQATGSGQAWSPPLGYVGQYVLSARPAGFAYPNTYGWYVGVYSPDGGYGESYYYRKIAFTNASVSVVEAPLTRPVRDRERLPLNLEP